MQIERIDNVFEEPEDEKSIPEPALVRRAASYSDFYHVVRAQMVKDARTKRKSKSQGRRRTWDALMLQGADDLSKFQPTSLSRNEACDGELIESAQQEYSYGKRDLWFRELP